MYILFHSVLLPDHARPAYLAYPARLKEASRFCINVHSPYVFPLPCTVRKEVATRRFCPSSPHSASTITAACTTLDLLEGRRRSPVLVLVFIMHSNYNSSRQYKRPHHTPHDRNEGSSSSSRPIPQSAYVQAYESQLIYGQADRAEDLYAKGGRGLMRWQGEGNDEIWADR